MQAPPNVSAANAAPLTCPLLLMAGRTASLVAVAPASARRRAGLPGGAELGQGGGHFSNHGHVVVPDAQVSELCPTAR